MSREDVPVEVPKVVAGRVFLMLGKLHPAPALPRRPLGEHLTAIDAFGKEGERFQFLEELGVEEGHTGSSRANRIRPETVRNGSRPGPHRPPGDSNPRRRIRFTEDLGQNIIRLDSVGLAFKVEDQTVAKHLRRGGAEVFSGDMVAMIENGEDLGGQNQRLSSARTGPVTHIVTGH